MTAESDNARIDSLDPAGTGSFDVVRSPVVLPPPALTQESGLDVIAAEKRRIARGKTVALAVGAVLLFSGYSSDAPKDVVKPDTTSASMPTSASSVADIGNMTMGTELDTIHDLSPLEATFPLVGFVAPIALGRAMRSRRTATIVERLGDSFRAFRERLRLRQSQ